MGPAAPTPLDRKINGKMKGVLYPSKRIRKYRSEIRVSGWEKKLWIGSFDTEMEAGQAFDAARHCFGKPTINFAYDQHFFRYIGKLPNDAKEVKDIVQKEVEHTLKAAKEAMLQLPSEKLPVVHVNDEGTENLHSSSPGPQNLVMEPLQSSDSNSIELPHGKITSSFDSKLSQDDMVVDKLLQEGLGNKRSEEPTRYPAILGNIVIGDFAGDKFLALAATGYAADQMPIDEGFGISVDRDGEAMDATADGRQSDQQTDFVQIFSTSEETDIHSLSFCSCGQGNLQSPICCEYAGISLKEVKQSDAAQSGDPPELHDMSTPVFYTDDSCGRFNTLKCREFFTKVKELQVGGSAEPMIEEEIFDIAEYTNGSQIFFYSVHVKPLSDWAVKDSSLLNEHLKLYMLLLSLISDLLECSDSYCAATSILTALCKLESSKFVIYYAFTRVTNTHDMMRSRVTIDVSKMPPWDVDNNIPLLVDTLWALGKDILKNHEDLLESVLRHKNELAWRWTRQSQ